MEHPDKSQRLPQFIYHSRVITPYLLPADGSILQRESESSLLHRASVDLPERVDNTKKGDEGYKLMQNYRILSFR